MKLRIVFFGSPAIAVPFLSLLMEHEHVVGIVTRPDKPSGRGHKVSPTAISGVPRGSIDIQKPKTLIDTNVKDWLKQLKADLGIIVAYGRILPEELLLIPRLGCVNIHFSLLPAYRGPAPIQHALLNNEKETGITSFLLQKKIDTGPIYVQRTVSIDPADNAESLAEKLVSAGKDVLMATINGLKEGSLKTIPQAGSSSYAPLVQKADGIINWHETTEVITGKIKALIGWPYACTTMPNGRVLKITKAERHEQQKSEEPGRVIGLVKDKGFIVQCSDSSILIARVIPEGKKEMSAWDFLQGRNLKIGDRLGQS